MELGFHEDYFNNSSYEKEFALKMKISNEDITEIKNSIMGRATDILAQEIVKEIKDIYGDKINNFINNQINIDLIMSKSLELITKDFVKELNKEIEDEREKVSEKLRPLVRLENINDKFDKLIEGNK